MDLTAANLTFLFLGVVVSLGSATVWALWEFEQRPQRHRRHDRRANR